MGLDHEGWYSFTAVLVRIWVRWGVVSVIVFNAKSPTRGLWDGMSVWLRGPDGAETCKFGGLEKYRTIDQDIAEATTSQHEERLAGQNIPGYIAGNRIGGYNVQLPDPRNSKLQSPLD